MQFAAGSEEPWLSHNRNVGYEKSHPRMEHWEGAAQAPKIITHTSKVHPALGTAPRVTNCFPTQISKQVLQDHTTATVRKHQGPQRAL